jgi:radical SAM protein with 4Fe4S-binding SPASM domain
MASLLKDFKLVLWSLFFLVPTGRGQTEGLPTAEEFEETFAKLYKFAQEMPYKIKTTEAQHYRRFILQQRGSKKNAPLGDLMGGMEKKIPGVLPINDGKGFVFISHTGEVFPSGFLPVSAGSVRKESLSDIYRNSPLLVALRDTRNLKGKCRECEFKEVCGGSRARAYALTGDMFAEESCCAYIPRSALKASLSDVAPVPVLAP